MAVTGGCLGSAGRRSRWLAGVSVDYYTRLERGNLNGVSESVLDALAHALQLPGPSTDARRGAAASVSTQRPD
jgi:Helix-turn-helix domain